MSENSPDLSILLKNPNQDGIQNILSFFKKMPIRFELILINPSPALSQINSDHLSASHLKGAASLIKGNFVFLMDSNMQSPLSEIIAFLTHFHSHPESQILVGDRFTQPKKMSTVEPKFDRWLRLQTHFWIRQLLGIEIKDVFCSFKAMRGNLAQTLFRSIRSSEIQDVEIVLRAQKLKIPIENLPVLWMSRTQVHTTSQITLFFKRFLGLLALSLDSNR